MTSTSVPSADRRAGLTPVDALAVVIAVLLFCLACGFVERSVRDHRIHAQRLDLLWAAGLRDQPAPVYPGNSLIEPWRIGELAGDRVAGARSIRRLPPRLEIEASSEPLYLIVNLAGRPLARTHAARLDVQLDSSAPGSIHLVTRIRGSDQHWIGPALQFEAGTHALQLAIDSVPWRPAPDAAGAVPDVLPPAASEDIELLALSLHLPTGGQLGLGSMQRRPLASWAAKLADVPQQPAEWPPFGSDPDSPVARQSSDHWTIERSLNERDRIHQTHAELLLAPPAGLRWPADLVPQSLRARLCYALEISIGILLLIGVSLRQGRYLLTTLAIAVSAGALWSLAVPDQPSARVPILAMLAGLAHVLRPESRSELRAALSRPGWPVCRDTLLWTIGGLLLLLLTGAIAGSLGQRDLPRSSEWLHYLAWAPAQQLVLGPLLSAHWRDRAAPGRVALAVGFVFALMHLPNFGLMMLCFGFGTISSYLYLRHQRLWPLALAHVGLAGLLIWALPADLLRGLRVGLAYLA